MVIQWWLNGDTGTSKSKIRKDQVPDPQVQEIWLCTIKEWSQGKSGATCLPIPACDSQKSITSGFFTLTVGQIGIHLVHYKIKINIGTLGLCERHWDGFFSSSFQRTASSPGWDRTLANVATTIEERLKLPKLKMVFNGLSFKALVPKTMGGCTQFMMKSNGWSLDFLFKRDGSSFWGCAPVLETHLRPRHLQVLNKVSCNWQPYWRWPNVEEKVEN